MSERLPSDSSDSFSRVDISNPPYRGLLTPGEVGRGVLAVHRNARRLIVDAVTLAENGRLVGAAAQSILAHEEAAKVTLLTYAVMDGDPKVRKHIWKQFSHHETKSLIQSAGLRYLLNRAGEEVDEEEILSAEEYAKGLTKIRERLSYVECTQGPERWSSPSELVEAEEALALVVSNYNAVVPTATPKQILAVVPKIAWSPGHISEKKIKECVAWSESNEAAELSELDLRESKDWMERLGPSIQKFRAAFSS